MELEPRVRGTRVSVVVELWWNLATVQVRVVVSRLMLERVVVAVVVMVLLLLLLLGFLRRRCY
jgi:hypothetical protein